MKQLSPDYRLHWRILKEKQEIEFVVIVNGTSWVSVLRVCCVLYTPAIYLASCGAI